jgi:hypothetical protein
MLEGEISFVRPLCSCVVFVGDENIPSRDHVFVAINAAAVDLDR